MSRCQVTLRDVSALQTGHSVTLPSPFFSQSHFFVQVRHFRGNVHSEEFLQRAAAANRAVDLIRWVINFFLETSLSDNTVRFHLRSRRIVTGRVADPDLHIKVKMLEFKILKMEQWRAVDAHNGGVEALNGALEGLYTSGRRFASILWGAWFGYEKSNPDPHSSEKLNFGSESATLLAGTAKFMWGILGCVSSFTVIKPSLVKKRMILQDFIWCNLVQSLGSFKKVRYLLQ